VLVTLKKLVVEKSLRLGFLATNNEALLAGMATVTQLRGQAIKLYLDS